MNKDEGITSGSVTVVDSICTIFIDNIAKDLFAPRIVCVCARLCDAVGLECQTPELRNVPTMMAKLKEIREVVGC